MVSYNNTVAKTSGQGVLSPLPSSGGVRYRDMRHEDIIQSSVIDILGHGPLLSFHFPCHWMKAVHWNCAILYTTLFFIYIIDGITVIINPETPGSEGLRLLLSMSAGLPGQQALAYVVGTVHVSSCSGIQEHIGHYGNTMTTHHQYLKLDAPRCVSRHSALHRRGSRQCIECQLTFTDVILCDNKELYCTRGVPTHGVVGCG